MNKIILALVAILSFLRIDTVATYSPDQAFNYANQGGWESHLTFNADTERYENSWVVYDVYLLRRDDDPAREAWRKKYLYDLKHVPAKKTVQFAISFGGEWAKREEVGSLWAVGALSGLSDRRRGKLQTIAVHCPQDAVYSARFDTLTMPNGSVASILSILQRLSLTHRDVGEGYAVDGGYVEPDVPHGSEYAAVERVVLGKCVEYLAAGDRPVVVCTVLSYNAENSLRLLQGVKERFDSEVRTIVGGQLIRTAISAYRACPFIDQVAAGDAETGLERLLADPDVQFDKSRLVLGGETHYARPRFNFSNYHGLKSRMGEMSNVAFGPFSDMRQLTTESCRGCSWGYSNGVCTFCSLYDVGAKPVFRPLRDHFAIEREFAALGARWIFDVSNQWIPEQEPRKALEWLQRYCNARRTLDGPNVNRYVYLTSNSITARTAPLLRDAGVRIAFVGIDGWNRETRTALRKPQPNINAMLSACRDNDLYVRTSLVVGEGLSQRSLLELPEFVDATLREHGATILSWETVLEIVLPGSPVWYDFSYTARANGWSDAVRLFEKFEVYGFLSWPDQERLSELYIRYTFLDVTYEDVIAARDAAIAVAKRYTIAPTFRDGDTFRAM